MITLDHALDVAMQLSYEQKQMLIEILLKRQIEERRKEITENARESLMAFHAGELKTESADSLIARLHASLEDKDET